MSLFQEIAKNFLAKFDNAGALIGFQPIIGKTSRIPYFNATNTALVDPATDLEVAMGGGATTFAALTDKASADLPAINTPLATALNPTPVSISAMTALAATDNGKVYSCSTAFSTNVPDGLTPRPSSVFFPPATGNLTLTPTGGATINGSASPVTRAFTGSNKLGVALIPNPYDAHDYTLSGS